MSSDVQTALITGASTGIGAVYADRLARRGYRLILVARDQGRMAEHVSLLNQAGSPDVEVLPADLTQPSDITAVEHRLQQGDVTLLVNNAGMSLKGGLLENDAEDFARIIALNVTAPTRLAAAAAKVFVAQGHGGIVNLSSVLALAPEMFEGIYSGTKAYLLNLSQAMAAQLGPQGVQVQAVLPGATRTELWGKAGRDMDEFPPGFLMEAGDMVDAALVGFDRKETVTIPPLPDAGQFEEMQAARRAMAPNLSRSEVPARYRV